jgi:DNA-binding LacI/PurR family transcriptional regulator/signal transduction histidine kinase
VEENRQFPAPRHPGARRTLGLLVDWIDYDYQNAVFCGVADAAKDHDVNLLCFTGGVLDSPVRFGAQRNLIYDLAGPESADGLLIMAGTLGNVIGAERVARFCERYRPLPMCSIAVRLEDIPSVLVDNVAGTRELIDHLVEVHQHRRIAFIRGPEVNNEAELRYRVYQDALAHHGIPPDPDLVAMGDFNRPSGGDAVRQLLDERGQTIDALVAANDYMAFGAMDALESRGLRVPQDIAVAGFDDTDEARFHAPPLTTVRQPLYEQGYQAAEMLLRLIAGEEGRNRLVLHTELVARRSCGCYSVTSRATALPDAPENGAPDEDAFFTRRDTILQNLARAARAPHGVNPGWEQRLLEAFLSDLYGGNSGGFLEHIETRLYRVREAGGDMSSWQDVITALRWQGLPCLAHDQVRRARAEDLWQQAHMLIGTMAERAQAQSRLRAERWARTVSQTGEAMITAFDVISLVNAVAEQFPRLGIRSCYLALYEGRTRPAPESRLILAFDDARPAGSQPVGVAFPSQQLVPPEMLPTDRRTTYVVEPLFFKEEQLGFVLFEMGPPEGAIYEALRDQVSAALKGSLLVQQVIDKDQERQRLLRDLEKRARELESAYQALQTNQEKLLLSEKMASLGRLTASIAHEMNTPLAAARTALLELDKLVKEYQASISDADVTADDHQEIADEMLRTIRLASTSTTRAADFVRGIKTQTRDLTPTERQAFNAVPYIEEALLLLSYALRQGGCTAEFDPTDERLELQGSPARLAQVVTNLVTNAIDASVPKGGGPIVLRLSRTDDGAELHVTDSGTGIAGDIIPRIFEPMFTTKPFGQGTGLGLSIVRDIITRDFNGSIDVTSEPGLGTTFTVTFPDNRGT